MWWTDDFDERDLLQFFADNNLIELGGDSMMSLKGQSSHCIGPKRQLGDWIEVDVDTERNHITCNCEDYNTDGFCFHVATFDMLQFGNYPVSCHQLENKMWADIRHTCVRVL